jgi:competence protein ComEC
MKARLNPPTSPLRPGGYDLARDLYFQGIGATGLVLGAITPAAPATAPGWRLRFATAVEAIRDGIDARIRAAIPGDAGAIASALITGKRDALTGSVFDAMFISGVGHVLSVSGYHMALVAGVVFFIFAPGWHWSRAWRCAAPSRNGRRLPRSSPPPATSCCPAPRSRRNAPSS